MNQGLTVKFNNKSGFSAEEVHVGFVTNGNLGANVSSAIGNLNAINDEGPSAGHWYSLEQIEGVLEIGHLSGRIYVCYGQPWQVLNPGYEPAQSPSDPNFFLRYDKMEINYTGSPSDLAGLTSIDYWSIPMSLTTINDGTIKEQLSGLLNGITASRVLTELTELTTPPVSGITGPGGTNGHPIPALVPGNYEKAPGGPTSDGSFARVLSPTAYAPFLPAPGGIPVLPYSTFEAYMDYLQATYGVDTPRGDDGLGKGICGFIKGSFSGVGEIPPAEGPKAAQEYDMICQVGEREGKMVLRLEGTTTQLEHTTMLFDHDSLLNPNGVYGGSATFRLNGGEEEIHPQNDVYGRMASDLFTGLNIGALGSEANVDGAPVKLMSSSEWFERIPLDQMFGGLQSNHLLYNTYASILCRFTQSSSFINNSRIAGNSVHLAGIKVMEIALEQANFQ